MEMFCTGAAQVSVLPGLLNGDGVSPATVNECFGHAGIEAQFLGTAHVAGVLGLFGVVIPLAIFAVDRGLENGMFDEF